MKRVGVLEIYKQYHIPRNLKEHMLRAAALAKLIIDEWNGPEISPDKIISVMLLHDMGNVVKMDLKSSSIEYSESSEELEKLQEEYIKKYGVDDHMATFNILSELGIADDFRRLALNKIFILKERTEASNDFNLKICTYADQRIAPTQVMPLMERLNEAAERSKGKPGASMNHPRIQFLLEAAAKIEEQVLQYSNVDKTSDVNERINKIMQELENYEIELN